MKDAPAEDCMAEGASTPNPNPTTALDGRSPSHSSPGDGIWEMSAFDRDCDWTRIRDDDISNQLFGIQEVEAEKMPCVGDKWSDCVERMEHIPFGELERKEDEMAVDAASPSSAEAIKKCSPNQLIGEWSSHEDHISIIILQEEEGQEVGLGSSSNIHQSVQGQEGQEEHIDPEIEDQQACMPEQPIQWDIDNTKDLIKISLLCIGIITQNFKKLVGAMFLALATGVDPIVELWKAFRGHQSSIERKQDKMLKEMEGQKQKLQSLDDKVNQGFEMLHECVKSFESRIGNAVDTLLESHLQLCEEVDSLEQQISDLEANVSHQKHFADYKDPTD